MGQNGRFDLGLRVIAVLAVAPEAMHTSVAIAKKLDEIAVMVRRVFLQLHEAGLIVQRKGPNGGATLKLPAKQIGLGDVFAATTGEFAQSRNRVLQPLVKRAQADALEAMNETTLAQVVKRMRRA